MDKQTTQSGNIDQTGTQVALNERPAYVAPHVTVMDEADVLKTFQFTSAAITWWVM